MSASASLRLALDQNFPTPLIDAVRPYLPADIELRSLHQIDPRLSELDDRPLMIALHQLGWDGLITNNYKMLRNPIEIAAPVKTRGVLVAVEGLGHDPLRAVGALLLELPALKKRLRPNTSNVFRLAYGRRDPERAWEYFAKAAERQNRDPSELWGEVGVTDQELAQPILPSQQAPP